MKNKFKTTSFWLGVGGAIVIAIDCLADVFGIKISTSIVEDLVVAICSILVLLGIVTKKNTTDEKVSTTDELMLDIQNFNNENNEE